MKGNQDEQKFGTASLHYEERLNKLKLFNLKNQMVEG